MTLPNCCHRIATKSGLKEDGQILANFFIHFSHFTFTFLTFFICSFFTGEAPLFHLPQVPTRREGEQKLIGNYLQHRKYIWPISPYLFIWCILVNVFFPASPPLSSTAPTSSSLNSRWPVKSSRDPPISFCLKIFSNICSLTV